MASNALKPCVLRNVAKRGYAAQAAAQQSSYALAPQEAKVTTLSSGAVVASVETNAPVSRLALLFKAGSRYESAAHRGASHIVRASAGLTTKNYTKFSIIRNVQQAGGSLTCESGREHMLYGMDMIRNNVDAGLEILADVATQPTFKPWELGDNLVRVNDELSILDPTTVAMELLHEAAFRNSGLGNSLYIPNHLVGSLTTEKLLSFHASTHTASRMAVVGHGVDHDALVAFVKGLNVSGDAGVTNAAAFGGGELRLENGSPVTVVAVAGPGASIGSSDAAALAVAQCLLGTGPHIKRGNNASSILAGAVASSGGIGSATAININYSDSGLFGFFVYADSGSVAQVLASVHSAVKNLKFSEEDVTRAKNQVKVAALMASEASGAAVEDMGLQALLTGRYLNTTAAAVDIDNVTAGAVEAALSKAMGGKLSMSAVGSLSEVPYLDQL